MNKTLALLLLAITACAVDPAEDGDGPDDEFLDADGKADTGGISVDEADGVLRVANELTYTQLHAAGVTTTASRNIVAYRTGDDGKKNTADDEKFDTLRELDAVPYVGPVAFAKLLAYAKAHGYIVPFDHFALPACTPMTYTDAISRFPAGQSWWHTGKSFSLATRSRDCNLYTGCGAWHSSSVQLMQAQDRNGVPAGTLHAVPTKGPVDLQVQLGGSIHMFMSAPEPGNTTTQITWECNSFYPNEVADHLGCQAEIQFPTDYYVLGFFPMGSVGSPYLLDDNRIAFKTILCDDGRFGLVSKLAADVSPSVRTDSEINKHQIAIWGAL